MDPKKLALLVGALVVAAIAAITAKNMFSHSAAPQASATTAGPVVNGPEVLVATRSLPVGTIIGTDSFRYQPWPKDLVENAYYVKGNIDPATLAGTVVRSAVTAGQPLTQGSLVKPGDRGFLAAALGPGMRAVTVSISAATGVGGFVFPGDRVDLVLTQDVAGAGSPLRTSETFMSNVRVLAVDQRTVPDEDEKGNHRVTVANSVTLEVTPRLAEKISVAQRIGTLSLSLRSIADNNAELDRAIAVGEVTLPPGGDPKTQRAALLSTASRPNDMNTTFVTGADVSRFQRRTVPSAMAAGDTSGGGGELGQRAMPRPTLAVTAPSVVVRTGPVVRVVRGNSVTEVTAGGK